MFVSDTSVGNDALYKVFLLLVQGFWLGVVNNGFKT